MKLESNLASMRLACAVREPQLGDHERLADLAGQLGYPCTGIEVRNRLDGMQDPKQYATYVAELPAGQIAGWIGVYIFRSVALDSFAEISGLVVDQQIRSRGIGKALLDAAEQWARRQGCISIWVRSNVTRELAHRFYTHNGYDHVKTQKSLRKSL